MTNKFNGWKNKNNITAPRNGCFLFQSHILLNLLCGTWSWHSNAFEEYYSDPAEGNASQATRYKETMMSTGCVDIVPCCWKAQITSQSAESDPICCQVSFHLIDETRRVYCVAQRALYKVHTMPLKGSSNLSICRG